MLRKLFTHLTMVYQHFAIPVSWIRCLQPRKIPYPTNYHLWISCSECIPWWSDSQNVDNNFKIMADINKGNNLTIFEDRSLW